MPVKFLEITQDPYTNTSNLFVLVISIQKYNTPDPAGDGYYSTSSGVLSDPNGTVVGNLFLAAAYDAVVVGSLSDEAFAHAWTHDQGAILVPPGYKLSDFVAGVAVQGTLEELAPFIRGM